MGIVHDGFVPYKGEVASNGIALKADVGVTVRSQVIRYGTSTPRKTLRLDIKIGQGEEGLLFSANTDFPDDLDPSEIGPCMGPGVANRFIPKIEFALLASDPKKGKGNRSTRHCRLLVRPKFREGVEAKVDMTKAVLPIEAEPFFVLGIEGSAPG